MIPDQIKNKPKALWRPQLKELMKKSRIVAFIIYKGEARIIIKEMLALGA